MDLYFDYDTFFEESLYSDLDNILINNLFNTTGYYNNYN